MLDRAALNMPDQNVTHAGHLWKRNTPASRRPLLGSAVSRIGPSKRRGAWPTGNSGAAPSRLLSAGWSRRIVGMQMLPVHPFGDVAIILVTNEHFRRFAARAILFCQLDGGTEGLGFAWNSYLAEKTGKLCRPRATKRAASCFRG
jgi:hypothetical protein